jgi:transposase
MRRLPFTRHWSEARIRRAYLTCRHPVEKVRWHTIWLLARTDCPRSPAQVAQLVGLSDVTVRALLRRWDRRGPEGLADRRRGNGRTAKLGGRRWAALARAVARRPPDGGLWTGAKAARYVSDRRGLGVRPETGWRWLRRLGLTGRGTRGRRPTPTAGAGKKLAPTAGPAAAGVPRPGGRGVGRGRGPLRPQAGRPPGVGAAGAAAGRGTSGCTCTGSPGRGPAGW